MKKEKTNLNEYTRGVIIGSLSVFSLMIFIAVAECIKSLLDFGLSDYGVWLRTGAYILYILVAGYYYTRFLILLFKKYTHKRVEIFPDKSLNARG